MTAQQDVLVLAGSVDELAGRLLVRLDAESSAQLPSRGQVAVELAGQLAGHVLVVEPDGRRGHWLPVDSTVLSALGLQAGQHTSLEAKPASQWPEVQLPQDFSAALQDAEDLSATWAGLTPMARWEWVRWVSATKNPATRARRVEVSISKLRDGKRRPCCFDLSSCTDAELAKSGKLPL